MGLSLKGLTIFAKKFVLIFLDIFSFTSEILVKSQVSKHFSGISIVSLLQFLQINQFQFLPVRCFPGNFTKVLETSFLRNTLFGQLLLDSSSSFQKERKVSTVAMAMAAKNFLTLIFVQAHTRNF